MWCVDDFILTRWTWKVFKKKVERLVTSKRYGKTDSDKTLSFSSFYQSCTWCFEACDHLLNSCYPGIQSYCQKMSGVSNQVLSKSIEVLLPFSDSDSIPRVSWPCVNSRTILRAFVHKEKNGWCHMRHLRYTAIHGRAEHPLFKSTTLRVSERSSLFFLILGVSIQAGHLTIPFPLNSLGNEPTHYCTVNLFNRLLAQLSKELLVEDTF